MSTIQIPIDAKVLYGMYEYAAWAKFHYGSEIAGWGHYKADEGIYKLAPLTKQIVSGAEVDAFPMEILNDTQYNISDMTMQWHSHVDMGVTPSGTDKKNIEDTLKLMPMLISIIVNCKNQYSARLDIKRAGGNSSFIMLKDAITFDVELVPYYSDALIMKEVKKKLSKYVPKPTPPTIYVPPAKEAERYDWRKDRDNGWRRNKNSWKERMEADGWYQDANGEWRYHNYKYEDDETSIWQEELFPEPKAVEKPATGKLNLEEFLPKNGRGKEKTLAEIYTEIAVIASDMYNAFPHDFVYSETKETIGLQHKKSSDFVTISLSGVAVNGARGHWADFIDKIGVHNEEYKKYYYPAKKGK